MRGLWQKLTGKGVADQTIAERERRAREAEQRARHDALSRLESVAGEVGDEYARRRAREALQEAEDFHRSIGG